ncbi:MULTISPECIES: hypothetical protein [Brevibacillus]|jgi:uncharacterized protein YpiB (UPF0302 family)|uniref:Uncharacterized protein n=1 Tax=Brevibacillus parabrevis TaxID=54914 RepID=A0A4Y3PNK3_BREPA|nr:MULTISPECIES: hypothetical protein [Brevibacillus]MBU8713299.1 hypothetical protein [Brevibacillus parabrevis]MDH6351629.1 uncharacterized protein YpiB (UPF0302 family) [Brevibacillus sp. 1238]MDR4997498.1 hypothetical protein [Brevibacillus parabrevis]MED2255796.1 hypothetical protein [Brevibacillus parabrevis]RNB97500.1 hypothetical protein EDM60_01340 [Brevibacillus parabrevis]
MSDFLFGTVEYFTNDFQACIMNNLTIENPSAIKAHYAKLKAEVIRRAENQADQEKLLHNLDKAYQRLKVNLIGAEDEENGS